MIKRDYKEDLLRIGKKEEIIMKKEEVQKKFEPLKRILIIGPNYNERCHFSENIYDLLREMNYDVKILGIEDKVLGIEPVHVQFGLRIQLTSILSKLGDWNPQLIIIDQISVNFTNDQPIPVFYHHRDFKRPPTVFYPTVAYFWNAEVIQYYEKWFAKEFMANVRFKEISYVPYNSKRFKPEEKIYKGICGIGFRETLEAAREVCELSENGPLILLEQDYNEFKSLGLILFDTPITDEKYRELIPKCEALWIPLSAGQYTTRRMIEAMACKTLCILKLESNRHEKILQDMGFYNMEHYIGIDKISEIEQVFIETTNKKEIIENAYNVVINNHTYKNRIDMIIKKYEEITNGS